MDKSINRLLDKIELLEKDLEKEKKNSHQRFLQAIDINTWTFKGIKILEMYDFYIENKKGK